MEQRLRNRLELVFKRNLQNAKNAFDIAIRDLDAELARNGTFWSGYRVRRSVELMKESALEFLAKAHDETVSRNVTDGAALDIVRAHIGELQDYFGSRIPKIARNTGGASQPKSRTDEFEHLLRVEFGAAQEDLKAEIEIFAYDFEDRVEVAESIDFETKEDAASEERSGNKERNTPHWLNRFQAVAWAIYRTDEAIPDIDNWHAQAGEDFYGDRSIIGTRQDLVNALQKGDLKAFGSINGGQFNSIPAVEWSRLRIDALEERYIHPYTDIRIALVDIKRILPSNAEAPSPDDRKPLSSKLLQAWWDGLSEEIRSEPQEHLWQLAKAAFPDNRVSRDRVRAFTLGRKRGRRPSGGKASAE